MGPLYEEHTATWDDLEERILRTVELVNALRKENEALASQLEDALAISKSAASEIAEAKSEAKAVQSELDSLRNDRKQVRTRIEKLLGQMDLLGQ
jgi:chromosome segregation ATPase